MQQESGVKGLIRGGFLGRLAFYMSGIAIGLVLVGFFNMAKRNEAAARQSAAQPAAQPGSTSQPQDAGAPKSVEPVK